MLSDEQIQADCPASNRRDSFVRALRHVNALEHPHPLIVEIGTIRNADPEAVNTDGWSTRVWAGFAQRTGGRVVSIDPDPKSIMACQQVLGDLAAHVTLRNEPAERILQQWGAPIDLLYVDGPSHPEAAVQQFARLRFHPHFVLVDDIKNERYGHKGRLLIPQLLAGGYDMIHCDPRPLGQALLGLKGGPRV